jgi:D-beta-D-heptose 7-phosphate kinase/D-beta-D-heptose 1-phosphate adenosyltransferase
MIFDRRCMTKMVAVSGGFDPIHVGHVRMIREAAKLGEYVVVIANSDEWLKRKKGYAFMAFEERAEIISALEGVDSVIKANDADDTVCETLIKLKPDIFANGGDRKSGNIPEYKLCDELGIEMVFGVGGNDKPQSSSWLVNKVRGEK